MRVQIAHDLSHLMRYIANPALKRAIRNFHIDKADSLDMTEIRHALERMAHHTFSADTLAACRRILRQLENY